MAAMSRKPYPASGWDESLFEAPDDSYVDGTRDAEASTSTSWPCHILRKLIQEGKFDVAAQVRKELEDIGVVVRPHPLYALAASRSFHGQQKNVLDSSAIASFVSWMSLIPHMNPAEELFALEPRLLLKCRDLAARDAVVYALKAACRGHFAPIAPYIIPYVMLRTPVAVSSAFIAMIVRADAHYFRDYSRNARARQRYGRWYSLAIRHQSSTAVAAAVSLLQEARKAGLKIQAFTYKVLLNKLRATHDTKHVRLVEVIQEEQRGTARGPLSKEDVWWTDGPLMLERLMQVLDDGHVPATVNILHFMDLCISSDNLGSLEKLRRHFYNSQYAQRAISQWVYAEMRYYLRSRQPHVALHIYCQHFSARDISLHVKRILSRPHPHPEGVPMAELPAYLAQRELLVTDRLVASSTKANWAAWKATLLLTPSSKLAGLYSEYIGILAAYRRNIAADHTTATKTYSSLSYTLNPSTPLSRSHFSLFVRMLARGRKLQKAKQVLQDMIRSDFEPQMKDLIAIADRYALSGRFRELRVFLKVVVGLRRKSSPVFAGGKRVRQALKSSSKIAAITARSIRILLIARRYRDAGALALQLHKFLKRTRKQGWLCHPVLLSLNRRLYSVSPPFLRHFRAPHLLGNRPEALILRCSYGPGVAS